MNPWSGTIAFEATPTADGTRTIDEGAVTWPNLPVPILARGDAPLAPIGRIEHVERDGNRLTARGVIDMPPGRYAVGVSLIGGEFVDILEEGAGVPPRLQVRSGWLGDMTLVDEPAWPETVIEVTEA